CSYTKTTPPSMNIPLSHILHQKGPEIITISPAATVYEAVHLMNDRHIGAVLVTDSARRLLGIFTERDVLSRIVSAGVDSATTPVQAVMTTKLITATRATTVEAAMSLFMERRIRHLPILEDNVIIGIVSIGDIN